MECFLDYFKPEKYVLDIKFDKKLKSISGVVKVSGEAKAEKIKFHAVDLSVDEVAVNGEKWDFECANGVLTLSEVPRGVLEVEIGYHGSLNENMQGAYLSTYEYEGRTETMIATQFESHYAREAFPCIDEPAAKAVFVVNIESSDKNDLILTNVGLGEPTPRMSTYLLAWVVGKFHGKTVKNAHGVEITTWCALNQDVESVDFANEIAAKLLEFYDDNFRVPYPLKKLDQVALPDFEAGAMENWGLVTYRESMLLASPAATVATKKSVALTVAHELAHQWFGDLVTMRWWDDLWLNESFASVMEYYAVDHIHPEYQIWEEFFTGDCLMALQRDAYTDVQSVHQEVHDPAEIATLFDGAIVYSKGARLMLMLIRAMGWKRFCQGIWEYFAEHAYDNTVGDDLWETLAPYAEFDVKKLMHAFIDQPGYPVITGVAAGGMGSSEYFALPESPFAEVTQRRFLLDADEMPESDWSLPEVREDMSGHYILNLSAEEFEERLGRFDELSLEEKLRLLIDRNLVCKTDLAESASLVSLVEKFAHEDSAAVWEIVATIVGQLKIFFESGSKEENEFKEWVWGLIETKLEEVGAETRADDDENTLRLRAILLGLDFYAETRKRPADERWRYEDTVLKQLAEKYSSDYASLDPEIRDAILDAKMYTEPGVLPEYLAAYQREADPEIKADLRAAMTLTRDEKNLQQMVQLLGKPEIVKPQDQVFLFVRLFRNPQSRERTFRWLTEHWDSVKEMLGDKSLDAYPRYTANMIRTAEEFEKWREFFGPMRDDPALARAIKIGEREIAARLRLIEADGEGVRGAVAKSV